MKCPICGDTLTPSKKNPDYMLCHSCRKKFRIPEKHTTAPAKTAPVRTRKEETWFLPQKKKINIRFQGYD